jgi:outer membrane protein TolC
MSPDTFERSLTARSINSITDIIKLRAKAGTISHLDLVREQAQVEDVEVLLRALQTLEKQTLFSLLTRRPDIAQAEADPEGALVEVAHTAAAEDHLRREVEAAREAFQISQLQYRQGTADLLTVLQAEQTLFSARDELAQATFANRQAAVHLSGREITGDPDAKSFRATAPSARAGPAVEDNAENTRQQLCSHLC